MQGPSQKWHPNNSICVQLLSLKPTENIKENEYQKTPSLKKLITQNLQTTVLETKSLVIEFSEKMCEFGCVYVCICSYVLEWEWERRGKKNKNTSLKKDGT